MYLIKATVSNQGLLSPVIQWVALNIEAGSLYIISGPMGSPELTD